MANENELYDPDDSVDQLEEDIGSSDFDAAAPQLVVALDHARYFGKIGGLEKPYQVLETLISGNADALMTSYGIIRFYGEELVSEIPTFMRLDGGYSVYREQWLEPTEWRLLHDVETAAEMGVDGVCVMLFMGSEVELETMDIVAKTAAACYDTGLTLMVEALPCPHPRIPDPLAADAMAAACRLAFEHGADSVKTYYTGSVEGFHEVTSNCPVPVLIAGGARMDSHEAVLDVVHGAMQAGGNGVVFGRNIWQHPQPAAMLDALHCIIHQNGDVSEALQLLQ